jgi:hypothetical protein
VLLDWPTDDPPFLTAIYATARRLLRAGDGLILLLR